MKFNKWTIGLAAVGVVSLASAAKAADDATASPVLTSVSSTILSGYVDTSIHWNPGSTPTTSAYIFGMYGRKDDGFNLNVIDLKLEKPLDESEWAAGYKAELWFGPNANAVPNVANGLGTSSAGAVVGTPFTAQDFAIKQAYVSLRVPVGNGIDFKLGVWDTPIGYESLNAGDNPNYTRSWGSTIEPSEHTGLIASYRFNESISANVGIANTTDQIIDGRVGGPPTFGSQSMKTYMGSVALTAPESMGFLKGGTLYVGAVNGRTTGGTFPDKTWIYVGAAMPTPIEGLAVGLAWDRVYIPNVAGVSAEDTDSLAGYIDYKATDKLTAHARLDYIHVGGDGLAGGGDIITGGTAFTPGDQFLTTTLTLDYALWQNVISRAEFRWDHDLGPNGGNHFGGFPAGGEADDFLLALNVIYKF
jgi:putative OmpL-like beta-barrel porin-2